MGNQLLTFTFIFLTLGWIASKVASKQGRDPIIWFILGVCFGMIALVILYLFPKTPSPAASMAIPVQKDTIPVATIEKVADEELKKLWYYLDSKKTQFGPMSFYALQEAWDNNKINATTYVWNRDMENWARLKHLSKLHTHLTKAL